jgi:ribosome-associated protein
VSNGLNEVGLEKARRLVDILEEKKAEDILLLDLIGECSFTDYFVICSGPSERTLRALSEEIRTRMKSEYDGLVASVEGEAESGWILVDFGDVIVHIFSEPIRGYYDLEEFWGNGRVVVHMV